jgi:alpha-tubulin suppressor-like RCC1 family protein
MRSSQTSGRAKRRLSAVLVAAMAAALLTVMLPGVARAWEQVGVSAGSSCPDVLVIGARGSGQEPQKNGGVDPSQYAADPYNGMGIENYTVYQRLAEAHPQLHIAYEGVQYAAEKVITSDLTEPSLLSMPWLYSDNVSAGARWMTQEVSLIDAKCKHYTKFVLSGYSQGAWVVHRALFGMSSTLRKQVVGVTMFGDPLYLKFQTINRVNNLVNIYNGSAWSVDIANAGVPKDMVAKTGDYCHTFDPVCQFWSTNLLSLVEHFHYVPDGDAVKAADFVSPNLPSPTAWTAISSGSPPSGQVGKSYKYTFKVSSTVGKATWTSSGALPTGLQLSSRGVLYGQPTEGDKTFTFNVKATDTIGRFDTRSYSVRIDPDPNAPPPCTTCTTPSVSAWGFNNTGQLGDGTTTIALSPVSVTELPSAKALAAGQNHSLAVANDGTVWAWGWNDNGQLGNGTTTSSSTPVQVTGLTGITAVEAGNSFSLALRGDGTVWAWGRNDYGQLGNGSTSASTTPVQVSGLTNVTAIAADEGDSALALLADGTVWAWGYNYFGQLGNGTTTNSLVPVQVPGLVGVKAIAIAVSHGLALRTDGTVWAWGDNAMGELGDGATTNSLVPVQANITGVTGIATTDGSSVAVRSDQTVWSWGWNDYGQLGNGTTTGSLVPVQAVGLTGITAVDGGQVQEMALQSDGTVWAWGYNQVGQLGDGSMTDSSVPVQVTGLTGVTVLATGSRHSLALHN